MENFRQLFPLGKAHGEAFCNRKEETEMLAGNIKSCKHTLLIAPRRYGKSSLAEKAIEKTKLPTVKLNFHLCTSEEEITQHILDGVIKLVGIAVGQVEKLMISIKKYLSSLEPLLSFGDDVVSLKLIPKKQVNHSVIISEAFLLIENLLKEKNKKAVMFLDEFQEINNISKRGSIEGAIRTAAQEMQCLAIIFSGSSRSLLLSMFEDENRPLYKLCRKIKLERISCNDYEQHIQKIAISTWGKPLDNEVFNLIMAFTHRHPYYVNYLCDSVWWRCKQLPSVDDISNAWKLVIAEEWSDALKELSALSQGQRRVLKYVANIDVKNLQSHEASAKLAMAASSIATVIGTLVEKDYLEQDEEGHYHVINPLLLAVLKGAED
jgi:hypothetical protein